MRSGMTKYVMDASAWIEYFRGESKGLEVKRFLDKPENLIFTNSVTIAEIASKIAREGWNPDEPINIILSRSKIITLDENPSKKVGFLHASIRKERKNFSYGDAFVLFTANMLEANIVTTD